VVATKHHFSRTLSPHEVYNRDTTNLAQLSDILLLSLHNSLTQYNALHLHSVLTICLAFQRDGQLKPAIAAQQTQNIFLSSEHYPCCTLIMKNSVQIKFMVKQATNISCKKQICELISKLHTVTCTADDN